MKYFQHVSKKSVQYLLFKYLDTMNMYDLIPIHTKLLINK